MPLRFATEFHNPNGSLKKRRGTILVHGLDPTCNTHRDNSSSSRKSKRSKKEVSSGHYHPKSPKKSGKKSSESKMAGGAEAKADAKFFVTVGLLCMVWYAESSTSNVINKIMMGKFPYPLTVAMSALFATGFLSIPVIRLWGIPYRRPPRGYLYRFLIPLALGKIIAISAAFTSIWKVPVSYAHTVKATMPLFAVFTARLILKESQTWLVYASLLPIVVGVGIATMTELSFNFFGLFAALGSTFTYALLNIFVKKTLQDTGIHHLRLLSMMAQMACVFLVPVWCLHDLVQIWKDWFNPDQPDYFTLSTGLMLATSGTLNFAQNLVTFTLIHKLTALSYAVANAAKRIIIITVSLIMLRNPVTPMNLLGMGLAIVGVFSYNRAKQWQKSSKGLRPSFTQATLSDATLFQRYSSVDMSPLPLTSIEEEEEEEGRLTMNAPPHSEHRILMFPDASGSSSNYLRRNGSKQFASKVV